MSKNALIYSLAALLGGVLIFSRPLARWIVPSPTPPPVLAKAEITSGKFTRRNPELSVSTEIHKTTEVRHLDYIEGRGTLKLTFNQGAVVEVSNREERDLRAVVQWSPAQKSTTAHTLLHLIEGQMDVKNRAEESMVVRAYSRGRTVDLGKSEKNSPAPKVAKKTPLPAKPELNKEAIRQAMNEQKALFNKCYTSLLKENPKAGGAVDVYFEVEPKGKVASAKVHKSNLKNEKFEKCIVETVKRTQFVAFAGKTKKIIFPLQFGIQ